MEKTTWSINFYMRISFTGDAMRYMDHNTGYGQASEMIYKTFKKMDIDCGFEIENPDIEICFASPETHYWLNKNSYKIAYTAWESTDLTDNAKEIMSEADEIWGTSPWVKNVFEHIFPNKPIFYYKHGIDKRFKPELRKEAHKPFTFFHIGEPSSRKDGQMLVEAFIELFGDNQDYRLVMKCSGMNTVKVKDRWGYTSSPSALYKNIIDITNFLTNEQLVGLYGLCDVFVYPSWGEGFGFQPLEALAMGMPVISTDGWADYKKYITFPIESELSTNPWQKIHPGFMLKPIKESLKKQMLNAVQNYDVTAKETFRKSFLIHEEYDWVEITKPVISRLKDIYKKNNKS
jgi:glycosyltransferase involved in cell wall biosynthesis